MAQTLAHLGQRYRAPPAATFDERFGPYQSGPMTEQELLRRLYEQQMLQQPGAVVPGYQERFGDPTKVISQSLPPQPLANLGATTGGPTLSDISADPVRPGQQYAQAMKDVPIPNTVFDASDWDEYEKHIDDFIEKNKVGKDEIFRVPEPGGPKFYRYEGPGSGGRKDWYEVNPPDQKLTS